MNLSDVTFWGRAVFGAGTLLESHFTSCKQDFTEKVLTQNLCSLARVTQNSLLLGSTFWGNAMKVKEKSGKI
jgi:hypothetical protein